MSENDKKNSEREEGEKVGKMSGLAGGVVSGAALGTSIMPVVGTVAGAIVGGVVGSEVGQKLGGALYDLGALAKKKVGETEEKSDVTAELAKLAQLHKDGVLDDEEFKAAKARILNI